MKTKTLLLLCFIAAFSLNTAKGQNAVAKYTVTMPVAFTLECTGDFIFGEVVYIEMETKQGWVEKVRNATLTGYTDATKKVKSGRMYELSQCDNGKFDGTQGVLTARLTLNGRLIAINHRLWHLSTNADGTVTVDFLKEWWACK
jgi:hypothetical protein